MDGLTYRENAIDEAVEEYLLNIIDQQPWDMSLKRRTQHYGYQYNYTKKTVDLSDRLGDIPDWLMETTKTLMLPFDVEQVIINEYFPGQGIAPHIDCLPCFGRTIASLSLGSGVIMEFTKPDEYRVLREELYLNPRSLLVLDKDARVCWKHGIPARKSDMVNGIEIMRDRRVSITYRSVKLSNK